MCHQVFIVGTLKKKRKGVAINVLQQNTERKKENVECKLTIF